MQFFRLSAMTLTLGLFSACGPNLAFLAERSRSETMALGEMCRRQGIGSEDVKKGGALLEESNRLWKDGKAERARDASEEAAGHYRMALARDNKEKAEKNLGEAEGALAKEKEKLATYREILEEMKTMRKP